MRRSYLAMALAGGVLGGLLPEAMSAARAWAGRNSSGTYSLPAGNPVTSGTIISSSWANLTLSDLAVALTNSLDRTGSNGTMLAPLLNFSGAVGAPGISWASDTASGLYRIAANDYGYALNGVKALELAGTGLVWSTPLTGPGGTFNSGTTNGAGVAGVVGMSLASQGAGVLATGGNNGIGVDAIGGSYGGRFVSTTTFGMVGTGGGTAAGGSFSNGTAATGATRHPALALANGDIDFSSVIYPASSTGVANAMTPANVPKAWAKFTTTGDGSAGCTVNEGFNIASCSANNGFVSFTYGTALAGSTAGSVTATVKAVDSTHLLFASLDTESNTTPILFIMQAQIGGATSNFNTTTTATTVYVTVFGKQ